jgi:transposase
VAGRRGTPLAVRLSGANRHDSVPFEALLDAVPPIEQPSGQRRMRPAARPADKAYDIPRCRQAVRDRRIRIRIARKGIDSSATLGKHRWVVERTMAWFNQFRRLRVRDERRVDIHEAFVSLGCSLICLNAIHRFC